MIESQLTDVLETVKDAGATRVPPWLAVVSALASIQPKSIGDTIAWLVAHEGELEARYRAGADAQLTGGALPSELRFEPDLGRLDRSINDHWLRERKVFAELLGKQTFMQATIYAITGLQLSANDAEMIEQFGVAVMTVDVRAWPMTATRRVAGRGGGIAAASVVGAAMMSASILGGHAAAECASFLRRAAEAEAAGTPIETFVSELLDRRERVMGFGRPVVGPDERAPVLEAIMRKHGRGDGAFVALLRRAEPVFFERRGLRSNAAAWVAAMLSDLSVSPEGVHAVVNHWLTVCVLAQATFAHERTR